MEIQQEISASINLGKKGKVFRVLIDTKDKDYYYARTEFDSPGIDNEVIIRKTGTLKPGDFCMVRITDAFEFDLFAELIT